MTTFRAAVAIGASTLGCGAASLWGGTTLSFRSTAILIGTAHAFATGTITIRPTLRSTTEVPTTVVFGTAKLGFAGAILRTRAVAHVVSSGRTTLVTSTSEWRVLWAETSATPLIAISVTTWFGATLRRAKPATFIATTGSVKAWTIKTRSLRGLRA